MSNRWWIRDVWGAQTRVEGNRVTVTFNVTYEPWGGGEARCKATLIFEGKNTGGAKRYELVGAGLEGYRGILGGTFEPVAKELFQKKVGGFEFQRFDEKTFVNNVLRQAEKIHGVKEGTYELCMIQRIDGGIKVLIYTDNKPFNPDSGVGRGELWLTFKYNDADLARGSMKMDAITQGYWSSGKWTTTEIDKDVLNLLRAAEWKVSA
jgi:hypothetical protein